MSHQAFEGSQLQPCHIPVSTSSLPSPVPHPSPFYVPGSVPTAQSNKVSLHVSNYFQKKKKKPEVSQTTNPCPRLQYPVTISVLPPRPVTALSIMIHPFISVPGRSRAKLRLKHPLRLHLGVSHNWLHTHPLRTGQTLRAPSQISAMGFLRSYPPQPTTIQVQTHCWSRNGVKFHSLQSAFPLYLTLLPKLFEPSFPRPTVTISSFPTPRPTNTRPGCVDSPTSSMPHPMTPI